MKKLILLFISLSAIDHLSAQEWTRTYSTYFGGYVAENGFAIVQDENGNTFIGGTTRSDNMPVTTGAIQPFFGGGVRDGFIAKFNNENQLMWCTYFGGNGQDNIFSLAVDVSGVYFCGQTESDNLEHTANAHQSVYGMNSDAFVGRLSQDGSLDWSTYFGGGGMDSFDDMIVYNGYLYCVGHTWSPSAVTHNANQSELDGAGDGLITVFTTSGDVEYSSYFGGNGVDYVQAIDVDAEQNIYISGQTASTSGLTTAEAYWTNISGGDDAFVAKLNAEYEVMWCTYFGGTNNENGLGLALDDNNNVWIAGSTQSDNLPTTPNALMPDYTDENGEDDCYLLQLNNDGEMIWSSYFGGNSYDGVGDLVFGHGRLFFAGYSDSNNLPTTANALQEEDAQYADCVLAIFNTDYELEYCTYYGAEGTDFARALAITANGVAIAGDSGSQSFMATADAYKSMIADGYPDAFYTNFSIENISSVEARDSQIAIAHVFPNPTNDQITLRSNSKIQKISIRDVFGKLVYTSEKINSTQTTIYLDKLTSGNYLIELFHENGLSKHKLVKL